MTRHPGHGSCISNPISLSDLHSSVLAGTQSQEAPVVNNNKKKKKMNEITCGRNWTINYAHNEDDQVEWEAYKLLLWIKVGDGAAFAWDYLQFQW